MPTWHDLGMKATTIKLEGGLLEELEAMKPAGESLTGYVRSVLRRELDRREMEAAAMAYRAFVESNEEEREWLKEWDQADLASEPRAKENES